MSAMLTSLSFGNIYHTEGDYLTLVIMNFVIALALLFTPLVMKSLIGDGVQATAQTLGPMAAMTMISIPTRVAAVQRITKQAITGSQAYAREKMNRLKTNNHSRR